MTSEDGLAVLKIYEECIAAGHATFESQTPNWKKWDSTHHKNCRWVVKKENVILGWAALSPTSLRRIYQGVAEVSIYVTEKAHQKNIGSRLMEQLILSSEEAGFWTLQSSIFKENIPSIRLHEKFDFEKNGTRRRIALMTYGPLAGQWRDTILLERRSPKNGESKHKASKKKAFDFKFGDH